MANEKYKIRIPGYDFYQSEISCSMIKRSRTW